MEGMNSSCSGLRLLQIQWHHERLPTELQAVVRASANRLQVGRRTEFL